jgi:glycosyltransferase involved in cell wall biosynthesis
MNMNVLFAIHGPADPATAVYSNASVRASYLRALGHTVDIVSPADFATGRWPRVQPLLLPISLASHELARYDVVVFHSYLAWAHQLRAPRRAPGRTPSTVVVFHGLEPLYHSAVRAELARTGERLSGRFGLLHETVMPHLLKLACRRADRVLCLNSREKSYLLANGWSTPDRVAMVPNGVSRRLLLQPRIHRPKATRILFTAQWLRAKGIRYLTQAFAAIAAQFPETELVCVGTGASAETVRGAFDPSVRERVTVLPRVNAAALAAELARADLFMFPSLSEGFSSALLEALASGLPVIATPAGAAPDLLTDGVNALLVPFADATALVQAASRLITDENLRRTLGAAARETAACYEWDVANRAFAAEILHASGRS